MVLFARAGVHRRDAPCGGIAEACGCGAGRPARRLRARRSRASPGPRPPGQTRLASGLASGVEAPSRTVRPIRCAGAAGPSSHVAAGRRANDVAHCDALTPWHATHDRPALTTVRRWPVDFIDRRAGRRPGAHEAGRKAVRLRPEGAAGGARTAPGMSIRRLGCAGCAAALNAPVGPITPPRRGAGRPSGQRATVLGCAPIGCHANEPASRRADTRTPRART